jgi:hypothetical protein
MVKRCRCTPYTGHRTAVPHAAHNVTLLARPIRLNLETCHTRRLENLDARKLKLALVLKVVRLLVLV